MRYEPHPAARPPAGLPTTIKNSLCLRFAVSFFDSPGGLTHYATSQIVRLLCNLYMITADQSHTG